MMVRLILLGVVAIATGCRRAEQRALSGVIITIDTTNRAPWTSAEQIAA